ncbi:hypothetical protein AgCh_003828 [Apium graveolens]
MHLWPSTRLRDSFKKDYLNKLQFNFQRKQQQQDATSSTKLLNDDDGNNVAQVIEDDGVCCIFCKDFLLIFSLCFCCGACY